MKQFQGSKVVKEIVDDVVQWVNSFTELKKCGGEGTSDWKFSEWMYVKVLS